MGSEEPTGREEGQGMDDQHLAMLSLNPLKQCTNHRHDGPAQLGQGHGVIGMPSVGLIKAELEVEWKWGGSAGLGEDLVLGGGEGAMGHTKPLGEDPTYVLSGQTLDPQVAGVTGKQRLGGQS